MIQTSFDTERMRNAIRLAEKHWNYLHTIPEKAYQEYKTTDYLKKVCTEYPVEFLDLGMETGLAAYLDAGREKTVALRADIDAVPTEHETKHLCGHDGHTATLLGSLHYLCGMKENLPYNILFIFQAAEEPTTGAKTMLEHGLLDKLPDKPFRLFGIHNRPEIDCGDVVLHKGPLMAEKSNLVLEFIGHFGHGSAPQLCIDPIMAAGAFISGIQTIVSRNINPLEPAICALNSVTAGKPDGSAPETALLTGTIRSFSRDVHARMEERVRQLAKSTAEAYECGYRLDLIPMVPAVRNSEEMYQVAFKAAEAALGREHITDCAPCLASEDFAVLGQEIPSFFFWVGSGTPGKANAAWHDPAFRLDPHYLESAIPVLVAAALTV